MSSGYAVGIDLGTSNTVAIVRWPDGRTRPVLFDGQPVLPSAVFLDFDGTLQIGRDAQRMAQLDPARFEPNPKRRIDEDVLFLGDRELPIVDVLAAPLRAIAKAVTDTVGHLPPAVITCPAAWGSARKGRLQQAATRAGWPPVHLVAEPIAAARYFTETLRRPVPPGGTLSIFDFGGGTLDVALVRNDGATFTVVGSGGAEDLGGLDIDAAIVAHLGQLLETQYPQVWAQIDRPTDELARRNRRMFWDDVRAAKEMLSRSTSAPIPVPGVSASLHLTRDELEYLATPLLRRATGELSRALRQANLGPHQLTGIFLVGGTSRVPLVSRLLHAETGIAPTVLEQPELPVAEGAVAGGVTAAPAQRGASVPTQAGSPVVPASGAPVSSQPISGSPISASPIAAAPISGTPSSGAPMRPHPQAGPPVGTRMGPAPMAYTTVGPPMHMPGRPVPAGPMWVAPGPAPRPPKRYRAWPWLLAITLVLGGLCYGGYRIYRSTTTDPLALEHTLTITDLAPGGLQQAFVTAYAVYAVGQKTDGSVEVSTISLASKTRRSYTSSPAPGWTVAYQIGEWVAVMSAPAGDGSRAMFVANPATDAKAEVKIGPGEQVGFVGAPGGLGYVMFSAAANTVRYGVAGGTADSQGKAVNLPAGARLLRYDWGDTAMSLVGGDGSVVTFRAGTLTQTGFKAPPGHPIELTHYADGKLYVAENKVDFQVFRAGSVFYQGVNGRQPVWIGMCGSASDLCVIDEEPGQPATRQLFKPTGGAASPSRAEVPYATVTQWVKGTSTFAVVPVVENDLAGSVVAAPTLGWGRVHRGQDVRPLGGQERSGQVDAVTLPTRPAGAAQTWGAAPQSMTVTALKFSSAAEADLGTITAIPASCAVAASRLACATGTDFRFWKVDRG